MSAFGQKRRNARRQFPHSSPVGFLCGLSLLHVAPHPLLRKRRNTRSQSLPQYELDCFRNRSVLGLDRPRATMSVCVRVRTCVWWQSADHLRAPPAPRCPGSGGAVVWPDEEHGSRWSDHQLCLFSPVPLSDRCICSLTPPPSPPTRTSSAARHLFITLCTPPFITPAHSLSPALCSFRDVNKSDSGGC